MTTFVTAVLSAVLGFFIAFSLFRAQRTWTERRDAYIELLNALSTLICWADDSYSINHPNIGSPASSSQAAISLKATPDAIQSLNRHRALGGIVISIKASDLCLNVLEEHYNARYEFEEHAREPGEISEIFFKLRCNLEEAQKQLNQIARNELLSPIGRIWSFINGRLRQFGNRAPDTR